MEDLLDVLRVQRHDFLNHLQVISGLIQLKKYDRAGEYIKQVADELSKAGAIARLGSRRLISEIFLAQLAASKKGIDLKCAAFSSVEKGTGDEEVLVDIVRDMLETAIGLTAVGQNGLGRIDFEISEHIGAYIFQVSFRGSNEAALAADLSELQKKAGTLKAIVTTENSPEGGTIISLAVPIR